MNGFGWDYPPGVTGSEPQITGEWPCPKCEGEPDFDEETGRPVRSGCWFCGGCASSGAFPASCPDCGSETEFPQAHFEGEPDYERVYCADCGRVFS